MTLKEAQIEAEERWGEQGVAMVGSDYEVGVFEDPNLLSLGPFRCLGIGPSFEAAFENAEEWYG